MSLRIKAFTTLIPQPASLHNYWLWIPGMLQTSILAESVPLPYEQLGEVAVYYRGRPVYFPARTEVPGEWTIIVADDFAGLVGLEIHQQREKQFKSSETIGQSLELTKFNKRNIHVMAHSSAGVPIKWNGVTLVGAWIKNVKEVQFKSDSIEPLKWTVTFRYDAITSLR